MNQYRIYAFREDGHFSTVRRLECIDRDQAVREAQRVLDSQDGDSGRVNTLSRDIPKFSRTPRSADCVRPIKSDNACDERQRDAPRHSKSPADGRRQAAPWAFSGHA